MLRSFSPCFALKISGSFKMNYDSVKRKMSRDNHVDICHISNKGGGLDFIESEASLRNPKDILHVERKFSFAQYISVVREEQMEVTAV